MAGSSPSQRLPRKSLSGYVDRSSAGAEGPRRRHPLITLAGHGFSLVGLLAAALLLRLALFASIAPTYNDWLQSSLELNDPITSWRSVLKAAYPNGQAGDIDVVSPYARVLGSGQSRDWSTKLQMHGNDRPLPPPIMMMLLELVLPSPHRASPSAAAVESLLPISAILFALADVAATFFIFHIAVLRAQSPILPTRVRNSRKLQHRLDARRLLQSLSAGADGFRLSPDPLKVAALYAFNPLTLLTCLARSGTSLSSAGMLFSLWSASLGFNALTGLGLAFSSALSVHPLLLGPAIIALCARQTRYLRHHWQPQRRVGKRVADPVKDWTSPLLWTAVFLAGIVWLSAGYIAMQQGRNDIIAEDFWILASVYASFLTLPTLSPSLSLWWYFFIEIFEHFRSFFLLVFNAQLCIWTAPVTIRFGRQDPLFATFLLVGVQAIFKPYPTGGDVAVWWALSFVLEEYMPYLRNPMLPTLFYLYSILLVPSFAHLFLVLGSANANFLYAVGLVWSLGGVAMWLDWAWAGGRAGWERYRDAGLGADSDEDDGNGVRKVLNDDSAGTAAAAAARSPEERSKGQARLRRTVVQV